MDMAGLRVRVVGFRSRLLFRLSFHLVRISFRARRLVWASSRRAFEVGKLLHPHRKGSATSWTIWTGWHVGQLSGL